MNDKTKKPNCYECIHRSNLPGSAHSRCMHPDFRVNVTKLVLAKITGNPKSTIEGLTVEGDKHGLQQGWFTHPVDFDPVWLIRCDGFQDVNDSADIPEYLKKYPLTEDECFKNESDE